MKITKTVLFILALNVVVLLLVFAKTNHERGSKKIVITYKEIPIPEPGKRGPFTYEEFHVDPTKPKKTINVKIVDSWEPEPSIKKPNCLLCTYLSKYYNLNFTEEPDFLFYSVFGKKHLKYNNCIKVFFSEENVIPNFNYCDYAITYKYLDFYGRHFKYSNLLGMKNIYGPLNATRNFENNMTKRKFCNFIFSENKTDREGSVLRGKFYELLSKYKHIDAPGKIFNNMKNAISPRLGNFREGKVSFIRDYKFTIAFENSNSDGYTTEKLPDALFAHTIPIYFGNRRVGEEYNKKAFIHVNDYDSLEDVVNKVIELDNDDEAYMEMLNEPPLLYPEYDYDEQLTNFLTKIIEKGEIFNKNPTGYLNATNHC